MPLPEFLTPLGESLQRAMGSRLLVELGLGLVALSLVGILVLPYVIAKLPADYFTRVDTPRHVTFSSVLVLCVRNLLGAILLLMGLAMLILPGQGVLTMLIGIVCLDFPSKRRLELWFLGRPKIMQSINAFRRRLGQPPLHTRARSSDPSD